MNETVNQESTATQQEERTFTQSELNAIVSDRLAREREKYVGFDEFKAKAEKFDAAEEAAKSDLQKAQEQADKFKAELDALKQAALIRDAREKVATEKGVPANLLTGNTEEECAAQADAFLAWRGQQSKYPAVKDGGETHHTAGGTTRDQFANWFNEKI